MHKSCMRVWEVRNNSSAMRVIKGVGLFNRVSWSQIRKSSANHLTPSDLRTVSFNGYLSSLRRHRLRPPGFLLACSPPTAFRGAKARLQNSRVHESASERP